MVPNPQFPRAPSFHGDTPTAPLMATARDDIEIGVVERKEEAANQGHEIQVTGLESYPGNDLGEKIESVIDLHSVVIISKSTCPFCRDGKKFHVDLAFEMARRKRCFHSVFLRFALSIFFHSQGSSHQSHRSHRARHRCQSAPRRWQDFCLLQAEDWPGNRPSCLCARRLHWWMR